MKLGFKEAKQKANRQIIFGWIITLISFLWGVMGLLITLYSHLESDHSIFKPVGLKINELISLLYQKTIFMDFLWRNAPGLYFPDVFTQDNIPILAVFCAFIFGVVMKDSGLHLKKRIIDVERSAQNKTWEDTARGRAEISSKDVLEIGLRIESKDSWYARPIGIISIGIFVGCLVNLISTLF